MAFTPTETNGVCFSCNNDRKRSVRINGQRHERSGVILRVKYLLGDSFRHFTDITDPLFICWSCRNKIDKSFEFVNSLRDSVASLITVNALPNDQQDSQATPTQDFGQESCRVRKHLQFPDSASSPQTGHDTDTQESCNRGKQIQPDQPKLAGSNSASSPQTGHDTDTQESCNRGKQIQPDQPKLAGSNSASSCMTGHAAPVQYTDHGYSAPCISKEVSHNNNQLITLLKDTFMDLCLPENLSKRPDLVVDSVTPNFFQEIRKQTSDLLSKSDEGSVLYTHRDLNKLQEHADCLIDNIIREMAERVPGLLKSMLCVAVPTSGEITQSLIPAIASAYSVLMKEKFNNLSAFHRLSTVIAIRGGLDERAQTRLQHLGLLLGYSSRIRIQDSMQIDWDKIIVEKLKQNPLIKITGDNLDIYVRRSNLSSERQNKDMHLFASNLIFSRVAAIDMDNKVPNVNLNDIKWSSILMKAQCGERDKLVFAYSILLARILCNLPAFAKYKNLFPRHISHEHSEKMARQSTVCPLPIMFKNETKHDDCMAIMDKYEEDLVSMYSKAFGSIDILRKYGVPVGGDQLTRVRLTEAKTLRSLAVTPEKKFQDLHPIVCEMWHVKQDLLEKCYKRFFHQGLGEGTLNYFKTILHRKDVNGNVKSRFQPHFDMLMTVGEGMVTEQFLEFLQMDTPDSQPDNHLLTGISDQVPEEQFNTLMTMIEQFIKHFGYDQLDNLRNHYNEVQQLLQTDELMCYSSQLCQWYLHLCELHDTAKEGDLNRTVVNCQYSIPFFFSHSKLSKYLVENIDFVLKCNYLLSPLQRTRVLEGAYVNRKGGKGQNVESDLAQEHSVGNQKALIKTLGANKSDKSISRSTGAADSIAEIISKFDQGCGIKVKSGHHSKAPLSDTDKQLISTTLRRIRPFRFSPGRICPGFKSIGSVPVTPAQVPAMRERIDQILNRLTHGLHIAVDDSDDDDDDDDDGDDGRDD